MIRWLLRLAEWLDKRFPPTVVVTQESYDALIEREHQRANGMTSLRFDLDTAKERIKNLEESMAAVKEVLAKGGVTALKVEKELLREAFVRGEFQRGPTRAELEAKA